MDPVGIAVYIVVGFIGTLAVVAGVAEWGYGMGIVRPRRKE